MIANNTTSTHPTPPAEVRVPAPGVRLPEGMTLRFSQEESAWVVRNRAGRVVNHIPGTQEGMMVSWELSLYTPVRWMARVRTADGKDFYETTVPSVTALDAVVVREIPDEVLNFARSHDQMGAWSFPVLVEDAVPLRLQFIRAMVADLANLSPAKLAGILKSLPESDADFLVGLIAHVTPPEVAK